MHGNGFWASKECVSEKYGRNNGSMDGMAAAVYVWLAEWM